MKWVDGTNLFWVDCKLKSQITSWRLISNQNHFKSNFNSQITGHMVMGWVEVITTTVTTNPYPTLTIIPTPPPTTSVYRTSDYRTLGFTTYNHQPANVNQYCSVEYYKLIDIEHIIGPRPTCNSSNRTYRILQLRNNHRYSATISFNYHKCTITQIITQWYFS